jgi:hypothetical protein
VGFENGLLKFSALHAWESVGFPGTRVNRLKIDDAGDLWAGTSANGLLFYNTQSKQWTAYDTGNSGIPSNLVTDLVIEPSGIKWIGTGRGLARFWNGTWEIYDSLNSPLASNYIQALGLESEGKVWVGTYPGLLLFNDSARSIGVEDRGSALSMPAAGMQISPNPFTAGTAISIISGEKKEYIANIYSLSGRLLRSLPLKEKPAFWDGRDAHGKKAAPGLYLVSVVAGNSRYGKMMTLIK